MIVLFSDFGVAGPYVGQMKAVLARLAPAVPVIDLFSDAPRCNPKTAAFLLAAYVTEFPPDTVFLAVVDPGVGDKRRRACIVRADGRWYVGPDNGLFNVVAMRAHSLKWWDVVWRPAQISNSFHGRDLFAPLAARIATGEEPPGNLISGEERVIADWPEELPEVAYIDHFGNAMSGLRASCLSPHSKLIVKSKSVGYARTFSSVPEGKLFWYENANGLAEIAVNKGHAGNLLDLDIGTPVEVL